MRRELQIVLSLEAPEASLVGDVVHAASDRGVQAFRYAQEKAIEVDVDKCLQHVHALLAEVEGVLSVERPTIPLSAVLDRYHFLV